MRRLSYQDACLSYGFGMKNHHLIACVCCGGTGENARRREKMAQEKCMGMSVQVASRRLECFRSSMVLSAAPEKYVNCL